MDVVFCYRYLPQMIVVVLGVGWAALDLDVKHLSHTFNYLSPRERLLATRYFFIILWTSLLLCPSMLLEKGTVLLHIYSI